MTQSPPFPLLELPAFKDLSSEGAARLQQETRGLKFDLGHQLVAVSYTHLTLPTSDLV